MKILADNGIGDEGAQHLASALEINESLTSLEITGKKYFSLPLTNLLRQ